MQIAHVAWDVHCGNLPLALAALVETTDNSGDHEANVIDVLAERNEVAVAVNLLNMARQTKDCLLFIIIEDRTAI